MYSTLSSTSLYLQFACSGSLCSGLQLVDHSLKRASLSGDWNVQFVERVWITVALDCAARAPTERVPAKDPLNYTVPSQHTCRLARTHGTACQLEAEPGLPGPPPGGPGSPTRRSLKRCMPPAGLMSILIWLPLHARQRATLHGCPNPRARAIESA